MVRYARASKGRVYFVVALAPEGKTLLISRLSSPRKHPLAFTGETLRVRPDVSRRLRKKAEVANFSRHNHMIYSCSEEQWTAAASEALATSAPFSVGDKVKFVYFPGVTATVVEPPYGARKRPVPVAWCRVDHDVMDMEAGDVAAIALYELEPA